MNDNDAEPIAGKDAAAASLPGDSQLVFAIADSEGDSVDQAHSI